MDFNERAAEVFQSEVTLQYWMMNCAFMPFEGTNTQVQSMIVEDNNRDVVEPDMNVDALATKHAEYLSTLNTGQVVNKVNAQSDYHDRPHDKAKNKTNGSSGSSKPKRGPQRGPQEWHKTAKCHGCSEVGHIKPFCPNKNKTDAKTGSEDSPVPISSAKILKRTRLSHGEEEPQRRLFSHSVWGYPSPARTPRSSVWHKAKARGSGTCSTTLQASKTGT